MSEATASPRPANAPLELDDRCRCGNVLFLDNATCLACGAGTGFCPACHKVTSYTETTDGRGQRQCDHCGALLRPCSNQIESVCNRHVLAESSDTLCDTCIHNEVIPDLSIDGHRERWAALEAAKRRVFRTLDRLGLPRYRPDGMGAFGNSQTRFDSALPLIFDFKADALPDAGLWRPMANGEKVYTGHANGRITINVKEADSVERERLRVDMNEGHRTLVGHFRHELGHYYWDLLVRDRDEATCIEHFGDHRQPDYASALERYYAEGPAADWPAHFISAYASMHPWEDFAETFALYLNINATLHFAAQLGFSLDNAAPQSLNTSDPNAQRPAIESRVAAFVDLGVRLNELARNNGLQDWMPQPIVPPVIAKLAYVDNLTARVSGATA